MSASSLQSLPGKPRCVDGWVGLLGLGLARREQSSRPCAGRCPTHLLPCGPAGHLPALHRLGLAALDGIDSGQDLYAVAAWLATVVVLVQ